MSLYQSLRANPPTIEIKENANEVLFTLVSAMCDNKSTLRFKREPRGEFSMNLLGQAFSNMQAKFDRYDMEWAADEGNWNRVISMINSGTGRVSTARSR
jgi:hypothetical protein